MAGIDVRHLGDFIREQRASNGLSLRQLARTAGVSNPYLSQIERGLRKPSAEILQQLAKGLRISAEALYIQAGMLEQREAGGAVVDAIHSDENLTERQKQVLLEVFESFRRENAAAALARATIAAAEDPDADVLSTSDLSTSDLSTIAGDAGTAPSAEPGTPQTTTSGATGPRRRRSTSRSAAAVTGSDGDAETSAL